LLIDPVASIEHGGTTLEPAALALLGPAPEGCGHT
jgi:hypothetical protein